MFYMKHLLVLSLALLLAACGGSSSSANDTNNDLDNNKNNYTPAVTSLSQMKLVDAQGKPLADATVSISPKAIPVAVQADNSEFSNISTDAENNLTLNNLPAGAYTLKITIKDVTVTSEIIIDNSNSSKLATIAAPIVVDGDNITPLQDRKSTRLNSSHVRISYAVFCLKKKKSEI